MSFKQINTYIQMMVVEIVDRPDITIKIFQYINQNGIYLKQRIKITKLV